MFSSQEQSMLNVENLENTENTKGKMTHISSTPKLFIILLCPLALPFPSPLLCPSLLLSLLTSLWLHKSSIVFYCLCFNFSNMLWKCFNINVYSFSITFFIEVNLTVKCPVKFYEFYKCIQPCDQRCNPDIELLQLSVHSPP